MIIAFLYFIFVQLVIRTKYIFCVNSRLIVAMSSQDRDFIFFVVFFACINSQLFLCVFFVGIKLLSHFLL